MNYKNTIYTVTIILIVLYSLILTFFELYQEQKLLNNIIDKQIYLNNMFNGTLILIAVVVFTIYLAKKIEKNVNLKKKKVTNQEKDLSLLTIFIQLYNIIRD